jgi:hypothetical protein
MLQSFRKETDERKINAVAASDCEQHPDQFFGHKSRMIYGIAMQKSYVAEMRKRIGSDYLMVPGGRAILENENGKVLLILPSDFGVRTTLPTPPFIRDRQSANLPVNAHFGPHHHLTPLKN